MMQDPLTTSSTGMPMIQFVIRQKFTRTMDCMDIKKLGPRGCWFYIEDNSKDLEGYLFLPFEFT